MVQMKRHTSSARKRRRSHLALKPKTLNTCPKCGKAVQPHMACRFCGTYRSLQAIKPHVAAGKAKAKAAADKK